MTQPFEGLISSGQAETTLAYLRQNYDVAAAPAEAMLATFARGCLMTDAGALDRPAIAAAEAEEMAGALSDHPAGAALKLDPVILVSHYRMVEQSGALPVFHRLVAKVAGELEAQPEEVQKLGRVRLLRRMLADAGFMSPPQPRPEKALGLLHDAAALLVAGHAEIDDLIDHLAANGAAIPAEVAEILSYVALAELRNYHVDWSSKVLRFLIGVGSVGDCVVEAVRFIALQRSTSGGYGFKDPLKEDPLEPLERFRSFHLPITLHAVWLIKLAGDFQRSAGLSGELGGRP
jgi:hypothetical protein